jgi:hypothetical protein
VLDDPAVLGAEDVDHRLTEVVRGHPEVVVQDDEVAFGDGALEVERRLGRLREEPPMRSGKTSAPSGAVGLCWV